MSNGRLSNLAKGNSIGDKYAIIDAERQAQASYNHYKYNQKKIASGARLGEEEEQWQGIYASVDAKWKKSSSKVSVGANGEVNVESNHEEASQSNGGDVTPLSDAVLKMDFQTQKDVKNLDRKEKVSVKALEILPKAIESMSNDKKSFIDGYMEKMVTADTIKDKLLSDMYVMLQEERQRNAQLMTILGSGLSDLDKLGMERFKAFKILLNDIKEGKLDAKQPSTVDKIQSFVKDIGPLLETVKPVAMPLLSYAATALGLPFKIGE